MTDDPINAATNLIGTDNMRKLKRANIMVVWEKDVLELEQQGDETCAEREGVRFGLNELQESNVMRWPRRCVMCFWIDSRFRSWQAWGAVSDE